MMQFTVPQFIDVEDKIFGPFTVRQFIIMLAGFMLMAVCYKLFDFSLFVTCALLIFAISGVFAFLRINGMPFHFFVLNFIQTTKRPPLRVWNNSNVQSVTEDPDETENKEIDQIVRTQPKGISTSRLAELSLIVDTRGAYKGEKSNSKINIESIS